ncbi:MAG: serine/threonine-protein phosphatase, partial [Acidimicrobiia bacterium]|nr:serine/threonine-protein phosphatase [Acidimicrobiia bacterium]
DDRSLGRLAAALAAAVSRPRVAAAIAEHAPPVLGATYVALSVANDARRELENLVAELPDGLDQEYRRLSYDRRLPAVDAYLGDRTDTLADRQEILDRYPDLGPVLDQVGIGSVAQVVVRNAEDQPLGVLSVGWPGPTTFDDAMLARLDTLGEVVGQTLERADLYDTEHQLVVDLQRDVLGAVSVPAGVEVVTRYVPAERLIGIGGDWYDVVDTGGAAVTFVVGDVTGHGVLAVTAMSQLRTLVGGLVRAGEPLETIIERVEAMLGDASTIVASVALFEVDTASWSLRYSSAGHPWALVRRRDGGVVALDAAQQSLLGVRDVRTSSVAVEHLGPGDVLVAYTDGLIERRRESITDGIERLSARLTEVDPAAGLDALADALLGLRDPGAGGRTDDDVALVVVRRPER